jgi:hypothetical protein
MSQTKDPWSLQELARSLSAVAARLEAPDAARRCAVAAGRLTQAMDTATNSNALQPLAQGLSAVTVHLEPADADRAAHSLTVVTRKPANANDLPWLALAGAALAARLGPPDAARSAHTLTLAISSTNDSRVSSLLLVGLSEVLTQPAGPDLSARSGALLAAVGLPAGGGSPLAGLAGLAPALEPRPCRLSTPDLVGLLERPVCIGSARRVVLDQLENRYHRPFADPWEFVHFAQEQGLGLNFDTPSQRYPPSASRVGE